MSEVSLFTLASTCAYTPSPFSAAHSPSLGVEHIPEFEDVWGVGFEFLDFWIPLIHYSKSFCFWN